MLNRWIIALGVLVALGAVSGAVAQAPCAHDGECGAGEICAFGVGPRLGLAEENACIVPRSLSAPSYEAFDFRELEGGGDVDLQPISVLALNDRGQVAGTVRNNVFDLSSSAFRYSLEDGLELFVTAGAAGSQGLLINQRGDVLGRATSGEGLFIDRVTGGVEFLEQGVNDSLRRAFQPVAFNDAGEVIGIFPRRDFRFVPYLYTPGDGWVNLWGRFAALRGRSAFPLAMNNAGDFLLLSTSARGFIVRRGERLTQLPGNVFPFDLGESRRWAGIETRDGAWPAFADPGERTMALAPRRFTGGGALAVTDDGVLVGLYTRALGQVPHGSDVVFSFDERRPQRLKVIARRSDFQALVPAGQTFHGLQIQLVNDRLEIVGTVDHFGPPVGGDAIQVESRPFIFSPAFGALALDDLVAGVEIPAAAVLRPNQINDRGQVLVEISERGNVPFIFRSLGYLLLTPVE